MIGNAELATALLLSGQSRVFGRRFRTITERTRFRMIRQFDPFPMKWKGTFKFCDSWYAARIASGEVASIR